MISFLRYIVVFLSAGTLYTIIELLWRRESHWSMTLLGGVCFVMLYFITEKAPSSPLVLRCAAGASFITLMEFLTGYIVNIKLGWDVWDYSKLILQIEGQICLLFSLLWFLLCIFAFGLCRTFQKVFKFIDKQLWE